ncbi:MAG: hypothetical protein J0I01_06585 [Stenotrophomonas nitritireducens]|uniref:hypothetical protein n=1 Tax=Stenotrophomonas nitritireducens TaxID=83617 RepID=UPI001ACEC986|nr:hypothetical protein [Stenotrophomonas nitritireducens]MBN8791879.1 hypothetical protein [Stenotrophomonas nitritireducens]MBN8795815.1 hypothetical protein [Stenotrophomonas nitritireducens]
MEQNREELEARPGTGCTVFPGGQSSLINWRMISIQRACCCWLGMSISRIQANRLLVR